MPHRHHAGHGEDQRRRDDEEAVLQRNVNDPLQRRVDSFGLPANTPLSPAGRGGKRFCPLALWFGREVPGGHRDPTGLLGRLAGRRLDLDQRAAHRVVALGGGHLRERAQGNHQRQRLVGRQP